MSLNFPANCGSVLRTYPAVCMENEKPLARLFSSSLNFLISKFFNTQIFCDLVLLFSHTFNAQVYLLSKQGHIKNHEKLHSSYEMSLQVFLVAACDVAYVCKSAPLPRNKSIRGESTNLKYLFCAPLSLHSCESEELITFSPC